VTLQITSSPSPSNDSKCLTSNIAVTLFVILMAWIVGI
jgi:hypothetical protein